MSLPITRKGDMSTGHDQYPPRAAKEGSADVFINGIPANREGDEWEPHQRPGGRHAAGSDYKHVTVKGSGTVFANGKALARIGDQVDENGDAVAAGSPNVFAG